MGNFHSARSAPHAPDNSGAIVNQESHTLRTPTKTDDGGPTSNVVQRRRAVLKLPSFKKKSRNVAANGEASSNSAIVPSSSRRRWKRFSSLKPRPVSSIAASSSLLPDLDLRSPSAAPSESGSAIGPICPKGKGKERESMPDNVGEEFSQDPERHDTSVKDNEASLSEEQPGPLSNGLVQELRNLQAAENNDYESLPMVRPPTPIPAPSIVAEEHHDMSHAELSEALGSWLGGRSQNQTQESPASSNGASRSPVLTESTSHIPSPRSSARSQSLPNISRANPDNINRQNLSPDQGPRPLPPTGTGAIVVVQGVVHTTDTPLHRTSGLARSPRPTPRPTPSAPVLTTPRNASSSLSGNRSSTPQPSSSRSRLSALADPFRSRPRPNISNSLRNTASPWSRDSYLGSRQQDEPESDSSIGLAASSDAETSSASLVDTSSSVAAVVSTNDRSSPEILSPVRDASMHSPSGEQQPHGFNGIEDHTTDRHINNEAESNSEDESESELSASSIEVLGTLLSVATAATAASLVSGTTEPLFSSGLAGRTDALGDNSDHSRSEPPSISPRDNLDASNTRIRNAWDSLRDRLRGRHRRNETSRDGADTSEAQLMRQMARALNLDFGGPNDAQESDPVGDISSEDATNTNTDTSQSRTLPPEGSFDRFLYNLQEDLRTALVEDYAARRARDRGRQPGPGNSTEGPSIQQTATESLPVANSSTVDSTITTPESDSAEPSGLSQSPGLNDSDDVPHTNENIATVATPESVSEQETIHETTAGYPPTPRTAHLDLPHLPASIESGSSGGPNRPQQAQGITGQPGAGINWWRLYRFPPMAMATPNIDDQTTTNSDGTASSSPSLSDSAIPSSSAQAPLQSNSANMATPSTTPPGSTPTQHVIPVIVVGLQSVPGRRPRNTESDENNSPNPLHPDDENDFSSDPSEIPSRDRAWPLRAASRAFNRIGRRGENEAPEAEAPMENPTHERSSNGSGRTYLIFVIGGYYPPNHSLVTGADDMNSFEALWELAELIGQVKPPVASKDDIEKSGLPVFKASGLSEYEAKGKVAANTIENCLICLEPYEPEDNLRLLLCRHAFHQQCVDRWLEQGRNNCPVCRSLGANPSNDGSTEHSVTTDAQ